MKQQLCTLFLFLATIGNAQFYKISDHNGKTLTVCKGQFVSSKFTTAKDGLSGGIPAYSNNENYTVTFCSSNNSKIRANFYYIGLGSGDHLYVYDGSTTASPLLTDFNGTKGTGQYPGIVTSAGTCLTFKFVSDNKEDAAKSFGWDAFIGCTPTDCVGNPPASDECITATEICNLGGYCGSTSGWYTRGKEAAAIDKPGAFCALIQNNSWLAFTAATTSASFDITASNCSDPSTGVQAAIFETDNCTNFTLKSTCHKDAQGNFTLTTTSPLIIGKKYYIMVDGFDGNDCEYTIKAKSGVATLNITANTTNTLCTGQPLILTANATGVGPFTYDWSPNPTSGDSTSVATYPVATGITYSCTVSGVCGLPTTVTYTPSVVTTPVVTADDSVRICLNGIGTTLTATLSASSPVIDFKNVITETIPDNNPSGISSDIHVGTLAGNISNQLLKIGININHGNVSELEISLKTPDGDVMILSSGNGLIGANFTNTNFTPTSNKALSTGLAPFSDDFVPQDAFSTISAGKINGTWSLIVKDKKALGTGLLTGWSLSFQNDFTYSWSPSTGLSTTSGTSVTANPLSTTAYTVTITDKAGCSGSKTVKVNVTVPVKPLVISPVAYCEKAASVPLTATATNGGTDLLWYTTATGGIGSSIAPTPSTLQSGTFYFYVSQKTLTCEGEREKITVIINKVKAAFTANPETGEMPLLVNFTNNSTTTTGGTMNYSWDFGTGSGSSQKDPTFTYDALGKYEVCLKVSDGQCVDSVCTTTINVFINALLVIPNVFTPNGDGINDVFTILGKGIASLHGEVYNRWGQKEYEWSTPNGGWDGYSATGIPSSQGTYYVIITAKGLDGKHLLEKGAITLLR